METLGHAPHTLLHHTFPFIMLDEVSEIRPGMSGKGKKLLSFDESMNRRETFPQCLLIEAAAQLSGIVSGREAGGFLAGLKDMRFLKDVRAGDTVEFYSSMRSVFGGIYGFGVTAVSGGEPVMKGELYLAMA